MITKLVALLTRTCLILYYPPNLKGHFFLLLSFVIKLIDNVQNGLDLLLNFLSHIVFIYTFKMSHFIKTQALEMTYPHLQTFMKVSSLGKKVSIVYGHLWPGCRQHSVVASTEQAAGECSGGWLPTRSRGSRPAWPGCPQEGSWT